MASESSSLSQPSLTTKDEFEGLEVTAFDANALWELLYDVGPGEEAKSGGGASMQGMEVIGPKPDPMVESYKPQDDNNNNNNIQDIEWFGILEEICGQCNDMEDWYGGSCMEEMNGILEMEEYSPSYSEIMCEEIGYIGLWQHY